MSHIYSRPTVGRQTANRRPTVDRQSADRFFGELFFTITQNTAGVHYVVLQVCCDVADISYICCEKSTIKSAINSSEDKQKYTFTYHEHDSKLLNDWKTHVKAENFNVDVHKKDKSHRGNHASASSKSIKRSLKKKTNNVNSDEINVSNTNHKDYEKSHHSERLGAASWKQNGEQVINTEKLDQKPSKITENVDHRPKFDSPQQDLDCKNPTRQLYCSFVFTPCSAKEQSVCCSLLNLPPVVNPVNVSQIPVPQQLAKPSKLYKTKGDGNCLFRAISYSISGRQLYHNIVRNKIVEHMITIENALRPHINCSLDNYINKNK